ncbi:hypothetical protein OEA41_003643 [Lepraria neglecta]|uniref:Uncharacterized protein n=1 Tax=Lepraria neglecta TaxID=209136 RepID=A0AAD9Z4W8_9LECA|nr:hypothetical protein OEA41_003643 [Lepraria neglecta]
MDIEWRFNSCVLFYALKSSDRPFAASLIGINARNHVEEELDLSRQFSFATASENPSEKNFGLHSCSTPVTPTPQRRGRRSWLPRLEFQLSPAYEHPPFQHGFDQMALAHSQTNLLPSLFPRQPANHFSLPSVSRSHTAESANHISRPSLSHSSRVTTISSSIYSHATNSETDFSRSLNTASHSYNSNTRSAGSRPEVPVPAIPERYLHKSHTLRNGGRPVRPSSRPPMPLADFWTYARHEQQKYNALPQSQSQAQQRERRLTIWPGDVLNLQPRPRVQAESPTKSASPSKSNSPTRSPRKVHQDAVLLTFPDKAILCTNMNKGNIDVRVVGRKRNENYESLRKGEGYKRKDMVFEKLERELSLSKVHRRKDSRTLVKMRQPWDSSPKSLVKSEGNVRRV